MSTKTKKALCVYLFLPQKLPNLTSPYPGSGSVYSCLDKCHSFKIHVRVFPYLLYGSHLYLFLHNLTLPYPGSGSVHSCINRSPHLFLLYSSKIYGSHPHLLPNLTLPYPGSGSVYSSIGRPYSPKIQIQIGIHLDLVHLQELPNLTSPYPGSGAVYSCISKLHSVKVYLVSILTPFFLKRT